jgi:hypothetical protein
MIGGVLGYDDFLLLVGGLGALVEIADCYLEGVDVFDQYVLTMVR